MHAELHFRIYNIDRYLYILIPRKYNQYHWNWTGAVLISLLVIKYTKNIGSYSNISQSLKRFYKSLHFFFIDKYINNLISNQ